MMFLFCLPAWLPLSFCRLANKQDQENALDEITIVDELDLQLVKEQSGSPCQVVRD